MALFNVPVLIRGGGDLASGVAYRLVQAGFPVLIAELAKPMLVRPRVSYGAAIYSGEVTVEGIMARHVEIGELISLPNPLSDGTFGAYSGRDRTVIPVVIDPDGTLIAQLHPPVIVDARVAKVNLSTTIHDAPLVIALGPGFTAGTDCHAVIETNRGHNLGRVITQGGAEPDTGTPGTVNGRGAERVIRAPHDGYVTRQAPIGEPIREGQPLAWIGDVPILAPFDGMLRGLIHESVYVQAGLKIGDLDPRAKREHCFTISDKSLAVGGGVVEAVLSAPQIRMIISGEVNYD